MGIFAYCPSPCATLTIFLFQVVVSVTVKAGKESTIMSTINQVRAAEEKMSNVLDALKMSKAPAPKSLDTELRSASDEYARAVRELEWT
jgi:hypothetical protein